MGSSPKTSHLENHHVEPLGPAVPFSIDILRWITYMEWILPSVLYITSMQRMWFTLKFRTFQFYWPWLLNVLVILLVYWLQYLNNDRNVKITNDNDNFEGNKSGKTALDEQR